MANPASKILFTAALLSSVSSVALAQNFDEMSRSDFISIDAGDAPQSNIAIQTPTPWPEYINDTDIPIIVYGARGVALYDESYRRGKVDAAAPSTVNISLGAPAK
jgi:hypothetical protein